MTISAKMTIIHQILKLDDRPFKLHNIYEETGLSPQNVNNHLARLVEKGALKKSSTLYTVLDRERLINELVAATEKPGIEPAKDVMAPYFSDAQTTVDQIVRARVLEKEDADRLHVAMNEKIDEMVLQTKRLKKWLNGKAYSLASAEKGFQPEAYEMIRKGLL